jgi:DNA-binding protein YbaB
MLEDLILAAVADAKAKMEAVVAVKTEKAMGRIKLPPGLSLPF